MVQLRSCYFCGTTGALSEYDALPPTAGVSTEASPQVILCNQCHTKLTNVLDPLVDSLEREAVDEGPDQSSSPASTPAGTGAPTDEEGSDAPEADDRSSQPEVTFANSSTHPVEGVEESSDTVDDSGGDSGADGDIDTTDDEVGEEPSDTTVEDEPSDVSGTPSETVDDPATEAASETDTTQPPTNLDRVYHKLLRFLRNREFPIPRAEAEAIAQSAYDLTATEASEVIQRTIDRDVLEERDGELHRR